LLLENNVIHAEPTNFIRIRLTMADAEISGLQSWLQLRKVGMADGVHCNGHDDAMLP
jgi:hypothetical protein